jgi:hypothetical protein
MAEGADEGIKHSFRITEDAFATGNTTLVNHKTYYFLALAYGYNNYEEYNSTALTGQDEQYKSSRSAAGGSAIRVYTAIPHKPNPEAGGTVSLAQYGDGVEITRWEGRGNGLMDLALTAASEAEIVANTFSDAVTYQAGRGPVDIKVVDPLNVTASDFELKLAPDDADLEDAEEAFWTLTNLTMLADSDPSNDDRAVYNSKRAINVLNEEVLLDWGISITWNQHYYQLNGGYTEPISGSISFKDSERPWLIGISDEEGFTELNWIRAGTQDGDDAVPEEIVFDDLKPGDPLDENETYEGLVGGTWAPYCLVSWTDEFTPTGGTEELVFPVVAPTIAAFRGDVSPFSNLSGLNNVDIVLTSDKP